MLRNIAVALLAATIFTAPALARSGTTFRTTGHATVVAPAGAKVVVPAKSVRHIKRHKRHHRYAHVRHIKSKALTAAPSILPVKKGARG